VQPLLFRIAVGEWQLLCGVCIAWFFFLGGVSGVVFRSFVGRYFVFRTGGRKRSLWLVCVSVWVVVWVCEGGGG
jgi:hypothetical protein